MSINENRDVIGISFINLTGEYLKLSFYLNSEIPRIIIIHCGW